MTVREKLAAAREIEKGTAQREPSPVSTKPPAAAPVARGSSYLTGGGAAPAPAYGAGLQAKQEKETPAAKSKDSAKTKTGAQPSKLPEVLAFTDTYSRTQRENALGMAERIEKMPIFAGGLVTPKGNEALKSHLKQSIEAEDMTAMGFDPRWAELARKPGLLTDEEREEARAAAQQIASHGLQARYQKAMDEAGGATYGQLPTMLEFERSLTPEEKKLFKAQTALRNALADRAGAPAPSAAAMGVISAIPGVKWGDREGAKALRSMTPEPFRSPLTPEGWSPFAQAQAEHPALYGGGAVAGNVGLSLLGGAAAKAVVGATPVLNALPKVAQTAVATGLNFGTQSAIRTAENGGDAGEIVKSGLINAVAGMAGSGASSLVNTGASRLLVDLGWQNSIPANMAVSATGGVTFAGTQMGTRMALDKNYRPSKQEAAQDLTIAAAFSAITSFAQTHAQSKAAAARLQAHADAMCRDFQRIVNNEPINGREATLDDLAARVARTRETINSTTYMGQQKTVNAINEFLNTLDDAIAGERTAMGAIPASDVEITTPGVTAPVISSAMIPVQEGVGSSVGTQMGMAIQNGAAGTKTASTVEAGVKADTTLFDRGILDNLNRARAYFVEYAKAHFPQTVKNQETGKSIGIPRRGIDKFLSGRIGVEKYASGFHIPELIERAHKIAQDTNKHTIQAESIPTYEYYDSPIQIEGVDYMAHIRVRNTLMGDKYYGHTISEVDNIEIELSARTSVPGESPAVQPVNAIDSSTSSIPQTAQNVNPAPAQQAEKSGQTGTLLAEAYDLAHRMGTCGQKGLSDALGVRKLGGDFNETDFLIGYIDVYLAALNGVPHGPAYLPATVDSHARRLSLVERMQAYHNGLNDAKARTQAAQSVNTEMGKDMAAPASQPIDSLIADIRAKGQGTKKIAPQGVEKLDVVDDADPAGYNITKMEKGAVTDGAERRTQLDGTAGEGVPRLSQFDRGREGERTFGQGDLSVPGRLELTEDKAQYSKLLDEARAVDQEHGWAVTPKTAEELAQCKTFLSEDGGVGFAVAPDGDIEAVFRNKQRHPAGRAMRSALPVALAAGGIKLDCYGLRLVNVYVDSGFVPVARVAFNPEFANPGWNEGKGRPDIYVMMATDTDPDVVRSKQGRSPAWTQAQLDALPLMEYDEAMSYRDRLLAEQLSSQGTSPEIRDGAPNSVGAAAEGPMVPRPVDPLIADIRSRGVTGKPGTETATEELKTAEVTQRSEQQKTKQLKNAAGLPIMEVKSTRTIAEPGSITQRVGPKGSIDRNFYGEDGKQMVQISNNGHGHKKEEAMGIHGEHAHDYFWDEDGNLIRGEARELTDEERRDNNDFL